MSENHSVAFLCMFRSSLLLFWGGGEGSVFISLGFRCLFPMLVSNPRDKIINNNDNDNNNKNEKTTLFPLP